MNEEFRTYRHEQAGFELPVHQDWETTEDIQGVALVAFEPTNDDPTHFAANVVVTVERLKEGESLDAWVARSREALQESGLDRLRVIDSEETEIGGQRAWRTLSHYVHPEHGGVNLEQWQAAFGEWGYVVSCSTEAQGYDDLADFMSYIAEGLRVEGSSFPTRVRRCSGGSATGVPSGAEPSTESRPHAALAGLRAGLDHYGTLLGCDRVGTRRGDPHTVRFYHSHPEARHELATEEGLRRIRHGNFPVGEASAEAGGA